MSDAYSIVVQNAAAYSLNVVSGPVVQSSFDGYYASLLGIPSTFAPSAHLHAIADVTGLQAALDSKETPAGVSAAVAALVNAAPATLDTLKELADALGSDPNFATTMTNALAGKAPLSHTHAVGAITGLGTLATQSPTGTPSASTFLRGDFSWQTIDLSGYVPYTGATGAVNLGSNAFAASRATLATGTITSSTPAISVTQTWNNAATTFTGILSNVTDTASNANSLLMDLQVGGSSRLSFRKDGVVNLPSIFNAPVLRFGSDASIGGFGSNALRIFDSGGAARAMLSLDTTGLTLQSTVAIAWSPNSPISGGSDLFLLRDASDTLAQRRSTNAQTFRLYNTYTDASNYERAKIAWESNVLVIGTEKAGTGVARNAVLVADGVNVLGIGNTTVDINVAKGAGPARLNFANDLAHIRHQGSLILNAGSSSFGIQLIAEYSGSGSVFNLAPAGGVISQSYGTTSQSYHIYNTFTNSSNYERGKIAWESNVLRIGTEKAGTGSARALELQTDGTTRLTISTTGAFTIANALDIAVGTATGTKIGTATTQKLGFFNATPVVQPTAVANATDAASVITQLNALLSRMRDLGLIAI